MNRLILLLASMCMMAGLLVLLTSVANCQWARTNGPFGGQTNCIVKSQDASGRVLHVGTVNGCFNSYDDGVSWQRPVSGIPYGVTSLTYRDGVLVAGTYGDGVYGSTDNGRSWGRSSSNGLGSLFVTVVAYHNAILFCGTWNGLYSSKDGGVSWTRLDNGMPLAYISSLSVASNGDTLYVGSELAGGMYKSVDRGSSWQLARSTSAITLSLDNGTIVLGGRNSVEYSTDDSKTWKTIVLPESMGEVSELIYSENVIYIGLTNGGVITTTDKGLTWTTYGDSTMGRVTGLLVENNQLLVTTSMGVYIIDRSDGEIDNSANGLTGHWITHIVTHGGYVLAGAANGGGLHISTDSGLSWRKTSTGLTGLSVTGLQLKENKIYASTDNDGGVYVSDDGGSSWRNISRGLQTWGAGVYVTAIETSSTHLYAATWGSVSTNTYGGVIYRSSNDGDSWEKVHELSGSYVDQLESVGETLLAVYNSNSGSSNIMYSTNQGLAWMVASGVDTSAVIRSFATIEEDVLVATSEGLWISTDVGRTWKRNDESLPNKNVFAISAYQGAIIVGTRGGLFASYDSTKTWTSINGDHANTSRVLAADSVHLWSGTYNNGVWRRPIRDIVDVGTTVVNEFGVQPNLVSCSYDLMSDAFIVSVNLLRRSEVKLKILDQRGVIVHTQSRVLSEPQHQAFVCDAGNYASGLYLYIVDIDGRTYTGKVLRLR